MELVIIFPFDRYRFLIRNKNRLFRRKFRNGYRKLEQQLLSLSLFLSWVSYTRGHDGRRLWQRNGQVERIVPLKLALSLREKRSSARQIQQFLRTPIYRGDLWGQGPRSIKNSRSEEPESRVRVSGRAIYKVSASFRFALVNDYTSFRSCFLSFHGFVLLLHPAGTLLLYAPSYCAFYPALSLREQSKRLSRGRIKF